MYFGSSAERCANRKSATEWLHSINVCAICHRFAGIPMVKCSGRRRRSKMIPIEISTPTLLFDFYTHLLALFLRIADILQTSRYRPRRNRRHTCIYIHVGYYCLKQMISVYGASVSIKPKYLFTITRSSLLISMHWHRTIRHFLVVFDQPSSSGLQFHWRSVWPFCSSLFSASTNDDGDDIWNDSYNDNSIHTTASTHNLQPWLHPVNPIQTAVSEFGTLHQKDTRCSKFNDGTTKSNDTAPTTDRFCFEYWQLFTG